MQAVRALFKPQFKDAIVHRTCRQKWTLRDRTLVVAALDALREKVGWLPQLHFPGAGEFWLIATFAAADENLARAVAVVVSRTLKKRWIVVGRLMVRGERFYRRAGRFNLVLKRARDVHLSRELRRMVGNCPERGKIDRVGRSAPAPAVV
ncbi:hypothetical protein BH09PLA1_BH09PLA1_04420 [soil metagenome]